MVKDIEKIDAQAIKRRLGINSLLFGLLGAAVCLFVGKGAFFSFALGFIVGSMNHLMMLKAVLRGLELSAEEAGHFVTRRYFFRFMLTAALITAILWRLPVEPLSFVAGFTVTLISLIATLAHMVKTTDMVPSTGRAGEGS